MDDVLELRRLSRDLFCAAFVRTGWILDRKWALFSRLYTYEAAIISMRLKPITYGL